MFEFEYSLGSKGRYILASKTRGISYLPCLYIMHTLKESDDYTNLYRKMELFFICVREQFLWSLTVEAHDRPTHFVNFHVLPTKYRIGIQNVLLWTQALDTFCVGCTEYFSYILDIQILLPCLFSYKFQDIENIFFIICRKDSRTGSASFIVQLENPYVSTFKSANYYQICYGWLTGSDGL